MINQTSTFTLPADSHVLIVTEALEDMSTFQFDYQMQEKYDLMLVPYGIGAILFCFAFLTAVCIFFPLSVLTKTHVDENSNKWRFEAH